MFNKMSEQVIVEHVRCRICLDSSPDKAYHSLNSQFPSYFKVKYSVSKILQILTSYKLLLSHGLPSEICVTCLESLRESYFFIKKFHKSQKYLKEVFEQRFASKNTIFSQPKYDNTVRVKPSYGDKDPLSVEAITTENLSLDEIPNLDILLKRGVETEENLLLNSSDSLKTLQETRTKDKSDNVFLSKRSSKLCESNSNFEEPRSFLDHNYTKDSNRDTNKEWETESDIDEKNQEKASVVETIRIINVCHDTEEEKNDVEEGNLKDILMPETNQHEHVSKLNTQDSENRQRLKRSVEKRIKNEINRIVLEGLSFPCEICPKAFGTKKGLLLHEYIHTPEYVAELRCTECGFQAHSKGALIHHKRKHSGISYKCDECDKIFLTTWQLKAHKNRMHGSGLTERFNCDECGKKFKYSNALKHHLISTHRKGDRAHLCGFCGRKFITKFQLKRHERSHTDERPYKCKYCPKAFRGAVELRSHHMKHEQELRYACEFCGERFISQWNMKVHWLHHGGDHKCKRCKKSYITESVLKFHYLFKHKIRELHHNDVGELEPLKIKIVEIVDGKKQKYSLINGELVLI